MCVCVCVCCMMSGFWRLEWTILWQEDERKTESKEVEQLHEHHQKWWWKNITDHESVSMSVVTHQQISHSGVFKNKVLSHTAESSWWSQDIFIVWIHEKRNLTFFNWKMSSLQICFPLREVSPFKKCPHSPEKVLDLPQCLNFCQMSFTFQKCLHAPSSFPLGFSL